MLGHPVGIFGVVIVEAGLGLELGHRQRLVAEHRDGQLAAADEGLGEQPLEIAATGPSASRADRVAVIAALR